MKAVGTTFGHRLKLMRAEKNMTLEEMGRLLGTSKQVLSRYENGQREPKINTVKLYAEKLHVDLPYLIGESEQRQPLHVDGDSPEKLWVVSSNGDQRIFHVDPRVARWVCELLDDPEKLTQVLDASSEQRESN